uniref:Uncharacterized protein n=1 Tax=Aliivibrio wodanis TaxID=80852 RepID=A0A5Q4YZH3_9GAMM|nr:hypothetical protein AW0309160_01346 [Aliivibrio wodanis]
MVIISMMDLITFFSGIGATLVGIGVTIVITERGESRRLKQKNEKCLSSFYTELSDLRARSHEDLKMYREAYFRIKKLNDKMVSESSVPGISISRPPVLKFLNTVLDNCFYLLSYEQREATRSLIYVCSALEKRRELIDASIDPENLSSLDASDFKYCISSLCVIYHLTSSMVEEKDRFNGIDKESDELMEDVLSSLKLTIEFQDLVDHKITI